MQGIGAAATRVITLSIVRDVYGGRMMAEVMSLVMMVFMIVPVIAPSIGQLIMIFAEWHMIFVVICLFALLVATLVALRLPETLSVEHRRPFTIASIADAFRIVLTNRISLCYSLAASFIFGGLFGFINSAQQVLVGIYGLGHWFPLVFAGFAGTMAVASLTDNPRFSSNAMACAGLSHGALIGFVLASLAWGSGVDLRCASFLAFRPALWDGNVPVRADRREFQRHGDGTARPRRRHRCLPCSASPRRSAAQSSEHRSDRHSTAQSRRLRSGSCRSPASG